MAGNGQIRTSCCQNVASDPWLGTVPEPYVHGQLNRQRCWSRGDFPCLLEPGQSPQGWMTAGEHRACVTVTRSCSVLTRSTTSLRCRAPRDLTCRHHVGRLSGGWRLSWRDAPPNGGLASRPTVTKVCPKTLVVQTGVLRVALELVSDVDPQRVRIDGHPTIVEQTVYVPSKEQSAVFVVNAQLGVAVEMPGLEDACWGVSGERASLAEGREEGLRNCLCRRRTRTMSSRRPAGKRVGPALVDPLDRLVGALGSDGLAEVVPSERAHAQLAARRLAERSQIGAR